MKISCKSLFILLGLALLSCENRHGSQKGFQLLMGDLADSWTTQNTEAAVACFTESAVYMQPPSEQFYTGYDQLSRFFGALESGTTMTFHNLWYNEKTGLGAGEFTFANSLSGTGVTGVVVVTLKEGKIDLWREYFISGPIDFEEFISTEDKDWKWHIGNYP